MSHSLFTLQDDIGADILEVYNEKKALSLPQSSQFLTTANASINATILYKGIKQWTNISSWPGWDVSIVKINRNLSAIYAFSFLENTLTFIYYR